MRVLTWNVFHGRAVPPAGRELFDEFAEALAAWEWDVALLQEVPPWWPTELGVRCGARSRSVLTSRNAALWLRRAIAVRWPDLIKSNGGGCNAILVRGFAVDEHRVRRLGWWPERRWMHAVRLGGLGELGRSGELGRLGGLGDGGGVWVGNLHTEARADQGRAAAEALRAWAGASPAALGGDFNVAEPELPGFVRAGGRGVDQVFAGGLAGEGARVLERGSLSDHVPVVVSVI